MNRIEEIEARLKAATDDGLGLPSWNDIAFLLAEVKRLELHATRNFVNMTAEVERADQAEALALSLAEALKLARDICWHEGWTTTHADAALSDPRLLKLKGGV